MADLLINGMVLIESHHEEKYFVYAKTKMQIS